VLAHLAGEDVLKDLFARGEDIHAATAGEMFGLPPDQVDHGTRSKAKMINFGIVYGLSAFGSRIGCRSRRRRRPSSSSAT